MKLLLVATALLFCFSATLAIAPVQLHRSFKCKACRFLDKAILEGENLSGDALKHFLDKKCDILGPLRHECKKLIDEVVKHVEKYGHKLDENELCKKLIHAC